MDLFSICGHEFSRLEILKVAVIEFSYNNNVSNDC